MTPEEPQCRDRAGERAGGKRAAMDANREGAEECPLRLFRWGDKSRKLRLG